MPVEPFLIVIADPSASTLKDFPGRLAGVKFVVSDDRDELRRHAPGADVVLFAHGRPGLLLDILPTARRLRWVHSLWAGVEEIAKPALVEHPALLTNGRGVFRWPLADWAMAAMLFYAFDLRRVLDQQEQAVWKIVRGTMLQGSTLGIVGYGEIGSAVAARARPFGMRIAAIRRRPDRFDGGDLVDQAYAPGALRELLAASDYVVSAMPLTTETRGMIGPGEIAAMKPNAVMINVGRGPVIDEAALVAALSSGRIRGAALDVFDVEPLPPEHPFWKMRNVLVSPHTADRVEGFLAPAFDCFLENLQRFLKGDPLLNLVDKKAGY